MKIWPILLSQIIPAELLMTIFRADLNKHSRIKELHRADADCAKETIAILYLSIFEGLKISPPILRVVGILKFA